MMQWLTKQLLFFPEKGLPMQPCDVGLSRFEEIFFESADETQLHAWFIPGSIANKTIIYFHGNAGNIAGRLPKFQKMYELGTNLFVFDYRGYGISQGRPSVEGLLADSRAAYQTLLDRGILCNELIFYGESLGGAMAIQLASEQKHAALILESTFTSIYDMGRYLYPFIPKKLVPDIYRSIDYMSALQQPLLVMHGAKDTFVPARMGQALYDASTAPKHLVIFEDAEHSDIYDVASEHYLQEMRHFLEGIG
jgi:uncharacterized protein